MTGAAEGGWSPHPDAVHVRPDDGEPEPLPSSPVVGLGAICALARGAEDARSQSFSVGEFVLLEDGRRVVLHRDRGFTIGSRTGPVRDGETRDSITRNVLNVVLPDDDTGDEHPWTWLAELSRARGLDVTADDLRGLPYEVVLTDDVTRWLAGS